MTDALITEYAGTRRGEITRYYQYGNRGIRVLDAKKTVSRFYQFDPSSDMMTERDPARQEKVLRRFLFDRYGMLEETFAFGERPRTFRYESGGRQIAVREGGEYGAVGKIFTFEKDGVTETAYGRNGEIGRVYQLDPRGDAITERAGGWYADVDRTIVFSGMDAASFLEPEAFLQFLMFTEWSTKDQEEHVSSRVAEIRSRNTGAAQSPYAFTGDRQTAAGAETGKPGARRNGTAGHASRGRGDDADIEFIPDADTPVGKSQRGTGLRRSDEISFEERYPRDEDGRRALSRGKSAEIPLDERFESSRREPERLRKGRSADIPFEERRGGGDR